VSVSVCVGEPNRFRRRFTNQGSKRARGRGYVAVSSLSDGEDVTHLTPSHRLMWANTPISDTSSREESRTQNSTCITSRDEGRVGSLTLALIFGPTSPPPPFFFFFSFFTVLCFGVPAATGGGALSPASAMVLNEKNKMNSEFLK
jgi:hypothetical protein